MAYIYQGSLNILSLLKPTFQMIKHQNGSNLTEIPWRYNLSKQ